MTTPSPSCSLRSGRPANPQEFISQWRLDRPQPGGTRRLAVASELQQISAFLGPARNGPDNPIQARADDDRMLHARLQGRNLGTFDLYFDSLAAEQIWAGQQKTVEGDSYYDVWSAFTLGQPGGRSGDAAGVMGEEAKPEVVSVSQYKISAKVAPPTRTRCRSQPATRGSTGRSASRAVRIVPLSAESAKSKRMAAGGVYSQSGARGHTAGTARQRLDRCRLSRSRCAQVSRLICVSSMEATCSQKPEPGCSTSELAGPGIPIAGWRWPASICSFAIPPAGLCSRPESESRAHPRDLPPGEQYSHWVSERPMPVAGFNLGKYSRSAARAGEVQVEAYASSGVERSFPKGSSQTLAPDPP